MKKQEIGKLKYRITLIFEHIESLKNGDFKKKQTLSMPIWAQVKPIKNPMKYIAHQAFFDASTGLKNMYEITMRKNYTYNALQSNLIGLIFKGKTMKIIQNIVLSADEQWMRTIVIDDGVTNG